MLREQLFESAEIARFTPDQIRSYEKSLKFYRDMQNTLDTAKEEGRVSGQLKMAKGLLAQGMSVSEIVAISDLTVEQITGLIGLNYFRKGFDESFGSRSLFAG
ncbi:MAG: hypothetical protein D3923_08310 [Candidatus Electrothrix sp. AR3]|nr:hypothetical protein [Candidatus Electrothrix sp. AR3]